MDHYDVAEHPSRSFVILTGFLGQVLIEYNQRHGLTEDRPVDGSRLMRWLQQRANPASGADGLSNLENEVKRQRNDVLTSILEHGSINLDRLRLWIVTHGAHELNLDEEFLSDTVEHLLCLKLPASRSRIVD